MERIPSVRREILADRPVWARLAIAFFAVAIATAVRWIIDRGEAGVPFVTFFPAILLVTLLLGWKYGAVTALASAIIANRLFNDSPLLFYVSARDALLVSLFALSCLVIVWAGDAIRRLVRDQEESRRREEVLKGELLHRVRNMFAVIQSLAIQTARNTPPEHFVKAFDGRLMALNKANDIMGSRPFAPGEMGDIVTKAIAPFMHDDNFDTEGPACSVPQHGVVPLSLALHELCTNAAKYGAHSRAGGKVIIRWSAAPAPEKAIRLTWQESGGPPVKQPTRKGIGSALLSPQHGLQEVVLDFAPDGLVCRMVIDSD